MDDRMALAGMALQGLLSNPRACEFFTERGEVEAHAAKHADALIEELSKVPAPSGGHAAVPPAADKPPTVQGVNEGAAAPAAQETRDPLKGGGTSLPTSGVRAASVNDTAGKTGAAVHRAQSDNPVSPPSRKAKGMSCGGSHCREDAKRETHDAHTCPKYAGRRSA
jgi:hypothetical protein